MRRTQLISAGFLLSALLLFTQCDKKLIRIQHDITTKPISFTIPEVPVAGNFDFTQNAALNLKAQLDSLNIKLFDLTSLTIRDVTLTIDDTELPIESFDALDNIYLELGAPNQANVQAAFKDPVPRTAATVLAMDVDKQTNLLPYAEAEYVTYHLKGKTNRPTTQPIKLAITIKWHIIVEGPF